MMMLTAAAPEIAALELNVWQICMRLLCAMVVGLDIGTEREYTHRPAGMRTHILVALGACAVMITGQLVFIQYKQLGGAPDPARLAAQVITGVGFLGAGTIIREGANVKGLTTAASLWAVACLGVAAGGGYYTVALAGMIFLLATLTLFEVLQNKLVGPHGSHTGYVLEVSQVGEGLKALNQHAQDLKIELLQMQVNQLPGGNYRIGFFAKLGGKRGKKRRKELFRRMAEEQTVISLREAGEEAAV